MRSTSLPHGKDGLSPSGVARLHRVLSGHVDGGDLPGLVALVAHGDSVHVEAIGTLAFGSSAPMRRDTIFRIASITKPLVAVAAMILVEDCKIRLDDPIERWIPELANRRVLRTLASELDDTLPAERSITLRDLLTSTMGFGSVMAMPDTYPIQRFVRDYRLGSDGPMRPTDLPSEAQWLERFASLPLIAQPGERFFYNTSSDVMGILIARVAGKPLGRFMRERIFDPLDMHDTSFHLPPEKAPRVPACYRFYRETKTFEVYDAAERSAWSAPGTFEFGSGGLLSTVDDYFSFSRMLRSGGRHANEQLLSRASVDLMTTDRLAPRQREGAEIFFGSHSSWGFGMAVAIARDEIYRAPGRYGWDGGFGTSAYTDPTNNVIGILMTQRMMDSPVPPPVYTDFWTAAYGALSMP